MTATASGMSKTTLIACCPSASAAASPHASSRSYRDIGGWLVAVDFHTRRGAGDVHEMTGGAP